MIALELLLVSTVAIGALGVFLLQRGGRLSPRVLVFLAGLSATALAVMVVTDWPLQTGNSFWSAHSVIVQNLSTLLLGGTIFLAFQARETQRQDAISESLAATAFGGLVDHVVDVDLALAYMASLSQPPVAGWTGPVRPLRWMRDPRCLHDRQGSGGARRVPAMLDLAELAANHPNRSVADELIDQALRRLMAAMRDWAPLLTTGRDGRALLVRIGQLRNGLLLLRSSLGGPQARHLWSVLRAECHVLALGLEVASGSPDLRPEVFMTLPVGVDLGSSELEFYAAATEPSEPARAERRQAGIRRRLGQESLLFRRLSA